MVNSKPSPELSVVSSSPSSDSAKSHHKLVKAKVAHQRLTPRKNGFVYKQHYIYLKADAPFPKTPSFLGINKTRLFSFWFQKYGQQDDSNPYHFVRDLLTQHGFSAETMKSLYVLTQPALCGWSFNPVSFWFCFNHENKLVAVLNEVNNTFGEHHKYLAYNDDHSPLSENQYLKAKKVFYVSPFLKVEGDYSFRYKITDKNVAVWINYYVDKNLVFTSSLIGKKHTLTNKSLLKSCLQIPFSNLKTPFLIHWQALKIWCKKIPYVPRNPHKRKKETRCR